MTKCLVVFIVVVPSGDDWHSEFGAALSLIGHIRLMALEYRVIYQFCMIPYPKFSDSFLNPKCHLL